MIDNELPVLAALAILFGVPLVVFASLAFVVWLMQRPRRRAESDLEAAMAAGDVEGAKAVLREAFDRWRIEHEDFTGFDGGADDYGVCVNLGWAVPGKQPRRWARVA